MSLLVVLGFTLLATPEGPATALVQRAENAYFAGEFSSAWVDLEDALKKDPEFSADRPRIHLLRAAVKLKLGDAVVAEEEAYRGLLSDPELDLADYPTDVERLFESARRRLPPRVVVRLSGLPPGAEARLDGRAVSKGAISVVPGKHRITAMAPGYLSHEETIEIAGDQEIPVSLQRNPASGRRALVNGSLVGVSALSAAGGGWALNGLSVTRANKQKAGPGQVAFYEKHERRFTQTAIAGFAVAAVAGSVGGYRLFRDSRPVAVTLLPAADGGAVLLTGRF